jgi:L-2-hydroxyglutarate oxidase
VNTDFLVIGAGVIGINVARELKRRFPDSRVTIMEKESACAAHASGRNSGVLHAGFYYTADSLKARFTRDGNRLLTEYCEEKTLPINKCGKLVVAKDESELDFLDELFARGRRNGVEIEELDQKQAESIEPRVITFEKALFSPTTSSVDPKIVVHAMEEDAKRDGIDFCYGLKYVAREKNVVKTTGESIEAGYVVNTAGLYADKIACDYSFSQNYRILPFKGLYLYSNEPVGALKTNIYPVPDLRNPFLGVHFTIAVDGKIKIGPTAIPAFWREQYSGMDNFQMGEFIDVMKRELQLFMNSNFDFKQLAFEELRKYSRSYMVSLASKLVKGVKVEDYTVWGKPGIRAQLVNIKEKKLEMDFLLEGDHQSMHVLNAVSPAFTCSLSFSSYVCDEIENKLRS